MSMAGKRVHVTRLEGFYTDFYADLNEIGGKITYELTNSNDEDYEGWLIYKENVEDFGPKESDYYELVSDDNKKQVDLKDFGIVEVENEPRVFRRGKIIDAMDHISKLAKEGITSITYDIQYLNEQQAAHYINYFKRGKFDVKLEENNIIISWD